MEKWQKLADSQAKLSAAPSGIRCANVAAVEGNDVLSKGQSFLEIALEQAEQARNNLSDENLGLRKLLLRTVNEVQSVLHHARSLLPSESNSEEVVVYYIVLPALADHVVHSPFLSLLQPCFPFHHPMLLVKN